MSLIEMSGWVEMGIFGKVIQRSALVIQWSTFSKIAKKSPPLFLNK